MSSPEDDSNVQVKDDNVQPEEALDSLGIVVGEIAHDFNNILSVIFGYVEMALSEIPKGQRARSDLEHVLAAGDRAKELVARILTYSKGAKLRREEISVEIPVNRAVNYISSRLPANVKLNSNIKSRKGMKILSNETEIYQVISNLCNNSLQSLPDTGGEIEVTLDYINAEQHPRLSSGDYAVISVKDTGCGMDIGTIENLYVPFFTTSRGDDLNEKRAGLGLTTVYNIVSSQNGLIYVDSVVNEGTTFEICFPLLHSENMNKTNTALISKSSGLDQKRILFIDDESSIVEMANQMLSMNNYNVTSFVDGNEALEHFSKQPHQFDLIITDLIMPAITGTELSSKISAINPNIPIILTTGFSKKITAATCKQWGISTVLNKPFTVQDLMNVIDRLVD